MAYYDSATNTTIQLAPEPVEGYPGWERIDCGCCSGLEWGGEYPVECNRCNGNGVVCRHKTSKVIAQYPGGPFV